MFKGFIGGNDHEEVMDLICTMNCGWRLTLIMLWFIMKNWILFIRIEGKSIWNKTRESQGGIKAEHFSNVMLLQRYDRLEGNTLEIWRGWYGVSQGRSLEGSHPIQE